MKALKLTIIIMIALMVLFLIIPVFLPAQAEASDQIGIKAKPERVFEAVNRLQNWKQWSPFETDSTMTNTYEGKQAGVGAIRHWKGQKMGEGSIEIVQSKPYTIIETRLNFGPQGKGKGQWHFEQQGDFTRVTWHLQIDSLQYPFGKWLGLIMPGMMKKMIDQGLNKLKTVSEKQ
jgi:ribosome-associated toxin RatA of RatAB toxin-antitoxin module